MNLLFFLYTFCITNVTSGDVSADVSGISQDVFEPGEAGYFCFRIPSLVRLSHGRIALYAEARRNSCADDGWIDIVYKISEDGGISWTGLVLLYSESTMTSKITIGNPAPVLVDDSVLMVFCRNNKRVLSMRSGGHAGLIWPTTPDDVTNQLGLEGVEWVATGPPASLRLSSGRILVPINWRFRDGHQTWGVMISDDAGKSWRLGKSTIRNGNEGQISITSTGSLLANLRSFSDPDMTGVRLLSWSHDQGETWSKPVSDVLPRFGGDCQGSTISLPNGVLLFSIPSGSREVCDNGRCHLQVFVSRDSGKSWQPEVSIGGDESAAYSSLMSLNSTHFAIVYERENYKHLTWLVLPSPKPTVPNIIYV